MPTADIIILAVIAAFGLFGLRTGLIHALGSLVGTILGVYLAGHYYETFTKLLIDFTGWNQNFARILIFILLFFISNRLIGVVFWLAGKAFSVVTMLPFLGSVDKLLGGILGLLEGALLVGIAIFFITKFPPSPSFMKNLDESKYAPKVVQFTKFLWPLLPADVVNMVNEFSGFSLPKSLGLPAGFALPPGITLPKDINDLKNFKLPPGFSLPSGFNFNSNTSATVK